MSFCQFLDCLAETLISALPTHQIPLSANSRCATVHVRSDSKKTVSYSQRSNLSKPPVLVCGVSIGDLHQAQPVPLPNRRGDRWRVRCEPCLTQSLNRLSKANISL